MSRFLKQDYTPYKRHMSIYKLIKHLHAHVAVIANEYWYGDGPPPDAPVTLCCEHRKTEGRRCGPTGEGLPKERR